MSSDSIPNVSLGSASNDEASSLPNDAVNNSSAVLNNLEETTATPATDTPATSTSASSLGATPVPENSLGVNSPPVNSPPVNSPPANSPPANSPPVNSPPVNSPPANLPLANSPPANLPPANLPPANSPPANSPPVIPNILEEPPTTQPLKRITRSNKQSQADRGQAEQLALMREMYNKEFSNIPEKFRPKPKAYAARAAYYRTEGAERNAYINSWLEKDRAAAEVRMGKRGRKPVQVAEPINHRRAPSVLSLAKTRKIKYEPSAEPLRIRAARAEEKLRAIANRTEANLMSKAINKETRIAAHALSMETKKAAHIMAKDVKHQADMLERDASHRVHNEAKVAFAEMEKQAKANLTAALNGRKPTKRNTHRLARARNSGRMLGAENFLKEQNLKTRRANMTINMNENTNVTPISVKPSMEEVVNSVNSENSSPMNDYEYR